MRGNHLTDQNERFGIFGIGRAHAVAGSSIGLGQFDRHPREFHGEGIAVFGGWGDVGT